jgi:hypothetical protein
MVNGKEITPHPHHQLTHTSSSNVYLGLCVTPAVKDIFGLGVTEMEPALLESF